jgi:hypothetical protein
MAENGNSIETRIARLETSIEVIHEDVSSIKRSIGEIALSAKPQWSLYISMAGLVLAFVITIVGGVGSGYVRDLSTVKQELSVHQSKEGHLPLVKIVEGLEEVRKERDQSLEQQIALSDEVVRTEMKLRHDLQDEKINELKEQIGRLRDRIP